MSHVHNVDYDDANVGISQELNFGGHPCFVQSHICNTK